MEIIEMLINSPSDPTVTIRHDFVGLLYFFLLTKFDSCLNTAVSHKKGFFPD